MITRVYANNFRCLVAFEARFDTFALLCGPNGAGKSSVFDVLKLIRDLASGDAVLGGEGERDIQRLEFTQWMDSPIQEFELELSAGGHQFEYALHLQQVATDLKPRIILERATCDGKELFQRDLDGVKFQQGDRTSGFPLDWRQAALGAIQPTRGRQHIGTLQDAIAGILILRPSPREMESESKAEAPYPHLSLRNLTSWFRTLSQEQEWTDLLRESLREVWPDFRSFRLENVGLHAKALQLRFEDLSTPLFFEQLSDGEKALIGLYMARAALATGATHTVLVDEPDNYVGLPELQPWLLATLELLDQSHQAILISHHPEILRYADVESGCYFWRDNHTSPTRIGPLRVPSGISPGEAIVRGWVNAQ
ncbi:MAG: AAA family ATPase [Armatimonadota bacterium]